MIQRDTVVRALQREARKAPLVLSKADAVVPLRFLFLFSPSNSFEAALQEENLIEKMGEALKISKTDWTLKKISKFEPPILASVTSHTPARFVIALGAPANLKCAGTTLVILPSARELIDEPSKKPAAWEELKRCLQKA